MISCAARKCEFWDSSKCECTDTENYVSSKNGGLMCRYNPDAILKLRKDEKSIIDLVEEIKRLADKIIELEKS